MFCPNCGRADQTPDSYCRQCGTFLPDLSKPRKEPIAPEQHVVANIVLSSMTIVACFTLAILLYAMLGFQPDTHPLIYATAGLLIAMGAWHIQTLWRAILLRKYFKKMKRPAVEEVSKAIDPTTDKLLESPDLTDFTPASVTENTTRHLNATQKPSS